MTNQVKVFEASFGLRKVGLKPKKKIFVSAVTKNDWRFFPVQRWLQPVDTPKKPGTDQTSAETGRSWPSTEGESHPLRKRLGIKPRWKGHIKPGPGAKEIIWLPIGTPFATRTTQVKNFYSFFWQPSIFFATPSTSYFRVQINQVKVWLKLKLPLIIAITQCSNE